MYEPEHDPVPAVVPAIRLQVAEPGENAPVELVVKLTVPVGVLGDDEVSVTVAVQIVASSPVMESGEQLTFVNVEWGGPGTTITSVHPSLPVWTVSPE